jgi:hypothetical protein
LILPWSPRGIFAADATKNDIELANVSCLS